MAKARTITGLNPHASTFQNASVIVRERLAEMYSYVKYIDNYEYTQELHDLRIAIKRVRYTLEIFADFLPAASAHFAEELAGLQDELGALHDSEVMLALLRLALESGSPEGAAEPPEASHASPRKPLLAKDLIASVREHAHELTQSERQGGDHFLDRQEQRRRQSYTAFRRHWEELEHQHFQKALAEMLELEK